MKSKREVKKKLDHVVQIPVFRKREANLSTKFWSINSEVVSFFQLVTGDLLL